MPTARIGLSACTVNGKIYVFGGENPAWQVLAMVEEYNPATDKWTKKSDMPTPRARLAVCVIKGKIYAIGGWPNQDSVEKYDPVKDEWTRKTPMLFGTDRLATAVVDDKIYTFGGMDQGLNYVKTAQEYDPVSDTWRKIADLPEVAGEFTASAVNGKIYIIGWFDNVLEYDPKRDKYEKKAPLLTLQQGLGYSVKSSTSVINGKIYVFGGSGPDPIGKKVSMYDPATDKWTEKPDMPTARQFLTTSAVGGKVYAIGGAIPAPNVGDIALSTVEEYDTGFTGESIDFKGKLPTMWGEVRTAMNR